MENKQLELWNKLQENNTLQEVQEYVNKINEIRGFNQQEITKTMLLLTEEVGELAKEVRKTDNNIGIDINKNYNSSLENEITDVFICLMGMCELLDMDIIDGLKNKEEINFKREWRKI